ncbi:unnamed protein product [Vitrella brassicaformis CCMP3155]|uniref:Uncharacterized protein n=1 Tax=Vitrella brassicaformis (strain CCMP3155) TaxID=1169540 RepID=A0A0G4F083_VITBC|nr:unnamed protein product [Vitrella brassicaformis CCMP3155]|eukprot:CEM05297.1 unnamed protein product [Vitrella brassicaformis CCMP3155]
MYIAIAEDDIAAKDRDSGDDRSGDGDADASEADEAAEGEGDEIGTCEHAVLNSSFPSSIVKEIVTAKLNKRPLERESADRFVLLMSGATKMFIAEVIKGAKTLAQRQTTDKKASAAPSSAAAADDAKSSDDAEGAPATAILTHHIQEAARLLQCPALGTADGAKGEGRECDRVGGGEQVLGLRMGGATGNPKIARLQ